MPRRLISFDAQGRTLAYLTQRQIDYVTRRDPAQIRLVEWSEFHKNGPKPTLCVRDADGATNIVYRLCYVSAAMRERVLVFFRRRGDGDRKKYNNKAGGGYRMPLRSGQTSANGVPVVYFP